VPVRSTVLVPSVGPRTVEVSGTWVMIIVLACVPVPVMVVTPETLPVV
jgi:hypothetical protein